MNEHIEITVKATPLWTDYVSQLLIEKLGSQGTIIEEDGTVKGYLPYINEPDLSILSEWQVSTKIIKDEEWSENWKKYWHPLKIGQRIVICPSWEQYIAQNNEIIISLDPGSAFGTGTHPTTKLCIQFLEQVKGKTMADVGTGSGILSIAAAKLGIESIIGVDNDASVIPVAIENAEINNVIDKTRFLTGSAADISGKYDLVVSNILAEVIVEIMPDLKNLLNEDGVMILSGIIDRKCPDVENALISAGLKVQEVLKEEGWVAILAQA